MEWVRGWLWAQGLKGDLVLIGYTLGASIALQYGLDYPDEVKVRDRLATLKPKLLLLRGLDDPGHPPEYEKEVHEAVPGSRYVKLSSAGHFPPTEIPDQVNALIEEFVATL